MNRRDQVNHFTRLLKSPRDPEEYEKDRIWLSRYYREVAIRSEEEVPPFELPDLLVMDDGRKIEDPESWETLRRPQVLEAFRKHVYGRIPDFRWQMQDRVVDLDRNALNGLATRKQITLRLEGENGRVVSIHVLIYLPNSSRRPVPAFLGLNFFGNQTVHADPGIRLSEGWMMSDEKLGIRNYRATEKSRGVMSRRWQVEKLIRRGYALVTACAAEFEPDQYGRIRKGVRSLAYGRRDEPASDEWGTVAAWAWGLGRIMDFLQTLPEIDPERVALFGHSRLGKAALWAAANDPRYAMVISNNSGCNGAALSRRRFGETIEAINVRFPHWFCGNHHRFNEREDKLPVDQHMLLALVAPRPLYVASAKEDWWADPRGEFLSTAAASPAWNLYGLEGLPERGMPPVNRPVTGRVGYHIRSGGHDVTEWDWNQYIDFADRHLGDV